MTYNVSTGTLNSNTTIPIPC